MHVIDCFTLLGHDRKAWIIEIQWRVGTVAITQAGHMAVFIGVRYCLVVPTRRLAYNTARATIPTTLALVHPSEVFQVISYVTVARGLAFPPYMIPVSRK